MYMSGAERGQGSRDDITLLVRNFNYELPNAFSSTLSHCVRFSSNPIVNEIPSVGCQPSDDGKCLLFY